MRGLFTDVSSSGKDYVSKKKRLLGSLYCTFLILECNDLTLLQFHFDEVLNCQFDNVQAVLGSTSTPRAKGDGFIESNNVPPWIHGTIAGHTARGHIEDCNKVLGMVR